MQDLRKYDNSYIIHLKDVRPGTRFRHCAEDVEAIKNCDAYQTLVGGKEVIFALNDLVEVRSA